MDKRGILRFSIVVILIVLIFFVALWAFPVNPEDLSGNLIRYDIIKSIEPKTNTETIQNSIKISVATEKPALCKFSKMKGSTGYYPPYINFKRTNDYYHEINLNLDSGRNNFKIHCRQLDSDIYDANYWSIKKI